MDFSGMNTRDGYLSEKGCWRWLQISRPSFSMQTCAGICAEICAVKFFGSNFASWNAPVLIFPVAEICAVDFFGSNFASWNAPILIFPVVMARPWMSKHPDDDDSCRSVWKINSRMNRTMMRRRIEGSIHPWSSMIIHVCVWSLSRLIVPTEIARGWAVEFNFFVFHLGSEMVFCILSCWKNGLTAK